MEQEIEKRLEERGIDKSWLTKEELEKLKKEIEAEKNGEVVLDGVLANPKFLYRKPSKKD